MKPVAIIGAGGHARVVQSALLLLGTRIVAATSVDPDTAPKKQFRCPIITDRELIERYKPTEIGLVLGIGSVSPNGDGSLVRKVVNGFMDAGYAFIGFQHPAAWIAPEAIVSPKAQIHAGAVIQPGAQIDDFTVINTRTSVDHDCRIGQFCHLAPGVTLSGDVTIGDGTHLGTGCSIIQGITIGARVLIAAGSVVVSDVEDDLRIKGLPARPF